MAIGKIIGAVAVIALASLSLGLAAERYAPMRVAPFRVQDHDPYLTQIARIGLPLIAAIQSFRTRYGRCPGPEDQAALTPLLPPGEKIIAVFQGGFVLSHGEIAYWIYQFPAQGPQQCSLSRKLSWDPDLVYQFEGASGHWLYAPGDGGDDVPLALDP